MLARLFTAIVSLAFVAIGAELLLRSIEPEPGPQRSIASEYQDLPVLTQFSQLVAKNQRGIYNKELYETNDFGLRGPKTTLAKPDRVFRIVALGDSIVGGEGVGVGDRYTSLIERALNQRPETEGQVEVINIGLPGISLTHAVQRLESKGLGFAPDLLIYGFTINDAEGPDWVRFVDAATTRKISMPTTKLRLLALVQTQWRGVRELFSPPRESYLHELNYNFFENPTAWAYFLESLDRLAEISQKHELCTAVLIHTHLYQLNRLHPFTPHYEAVEEAARARGLHVVQSLPYFLGEREESLWLDSEDSHPNVDGHIILTRALLDGLLELSDRCWRLGDVRESSARESGRDPT